VYIQASHLRTGACSIHERGAMMCIAKCGGSNLIVTNRLHTTKISQHAMTFATLGGRGKPSCGAQLASHLYLGHTCCVGCAAVRRAPPAVHCKLGAGNAAPVVSRTASLVPGRSVPPVMPRAQPPHRHPPQCGLPIGPAIGQSAHRSRWWSRLQLPRLGRAPFAPSVGNFIEISKTTYNRF
jgi:hypothetical protein